MATPKKKQNVSPREAREKERTIQSLVSSDFDPTYNIHSTTTLYRTVLVLPLFFLFQAIPVGVCVCVCHYAGVALAAAVRDIARVDPA